MPDLLERCRAQLAADGLLLQSDPLLPSVTALVAGEPVRGSWWGHALGQTMYSVMEALGEDPDVLTLKLVSGKITYLHRRHWTALFAIATSREPRQVDALPPAAKALLDEVERSSPVRVDQLTLEGFGQKALSAAAKVLEARLLAHVESVHTERGAHQKQLETWSRWAERVGFAPEPMSPSAAQQQIEDALGRVAARHGARPTLPWTSSRNEVS